MASFYIEIPPPGTVNGVTSVGATSPLSSSGGTTPNITIQRATTTQDGYLAASDFNIFNSKVSDAQIYYHYPVTGGVTENDIVMNATDPNTAIAPLVFKLAVNNDTQYYPQLYGVAKNVSGGFADIYLGFGSVVSGFSFGANVGLEYYLDPASPGKLTFTPPVGQVNVIKVGRALSATQLVLNIYSQILHDKGALFTSAGDGYDSSLLVGANTTILMADSTASTGLKWKTTGNLTDVGTDGITVTGGTGAVIGSGTAISQHIADTTHNGYLSSLDWNIFNNKQDKVSGNYITNPSAAIDVSDWNLYNNSGRTTSAFAIVNDLTYTAVASGNTGNGINVDYVFVNSPPFSGVTVTVVSPTHITVAWYNGPTLAQNPTATQIQTAWNATAGAVAIATVAVTGTGSNLQYITGSHLLGGGGDVYPTTGTGGVVAGLTLTRTTAFPLLAPTAFDLAKDAVNREGEGVSTDFTIDGIDRGEPLQVSFLYESSSGMVLGSSSDIQVFVYDITNAVLIPVVPSTLAGPVSTVKEFVGKFTSSASSINYRLIFHIATSNAVAWDFIFSNVILNDSVNASTVTQVPSLVLKLQPISGAVTDHMCVMWQDSSTHWVPATISGAALPVFGDDVTQLGFATNILGSTADIYIRGVMDGFSFGPFVGYNQYIDNTAGGISPLPSPFTDLYVVVGTAISSTVLNIQFTPHVDLISNSSGVPLKGGLLTSSAVNDGTGDLVLPVGTNGNVLVANSAATLGLSWSPAVVASAPFTYTTATRTLTAATATNAVAGFLSAADHTTFSNKADTASPTFTGTPTLPTGTIAVTQAAGNSTTAVATTAFVTTADNLKANLASPTFTGTPSLPTGTIGVTQAAGNSTTALATTAFVTTANNLKANLASPTFTGDINSSTGNVLISTIGKGLQVKTGTNAKIGTSVLVGGTVTVSNTSVTANSRIFLTSQSDGGTVGFLRITAKTAATSFVITSSSVLDTSTVAWIIVESIP